MNCANLGGLSEDIYYYFDRQPRSNFLHSFYAPPVRLEKREHRFQTLTSGGRELHLKSQSSISDRSKVDAVTYLIIVAFGEEQGTELAVQGCLVGLVAMFG